MLYLTTAVVKQNAKVHRHPVCFIQVSGFSIDSHIKILKCQLVTYIYPACAYTAELRLWRGGRPSIRSLRILGNRCMDPGKILWAVKYPPYPPSPNTFVVVVGVVFFFVFFFFLFEIFKFVWLFSFSLTLDPIGAKTFKTLSLPQITPDIFL